MASFVRPRAWVIPIQIAFALATIAIIPQTSIWRTTYSGASAAGAAADLFAGIGLMGAGNALLVSGLRPAAGWAAIGAAIAWLSADWAGWQGGPALPRTLAMGIGLYYLPLSIHLLALNQRQPVWLASRQVVIGAYLVATLLALALLLLRDPRIDLYCWSNCTDDVLLIANQPIIVGILRVAIPSFELVAGTGTVLVSLSWMMGGTVVQRKLAAFIAIPALMVGVGAALHGLALLVDPHEGPRFALHGALFQVRAWAAALLAAGLGWTVARAARSRSAIVRLAADLGNAPAPGRVGPALAAATGDAGLEVLYWLPHRGSYIDAAGNPRQPPPAGPQRAVTRLVDAGRLIGVATHDPSVIDPEGLVRTLGPAATLALENERLRAELLAKLDEVRASRARIVAAGDAARAQLERDLHDGAQQGLLAVAYELRQASAAAAGSSVEAHSTIGTAVREAEEMLAELREIAHGISPAILQDRGLGPALQSLADRAPLPITLRGTAVERLPEIAERTAYAVVASAIDAAAQARAPELLVRATRTTEGLVLEIEGRGLDASPEIADRVGAVDGTVEQEGPLLRVRIPCG